jgi:hypothetical protein
MLVQLAPNHLVDVDQVFHAERSGESLVLWVRGVTLDSGDEDGAGPWAIELTGDDAVSAWQKLSGQAEAAPSPMVRVAQLVDSYLARPAVRPEALAAD